MVVVVVDGDMLARRGVGTTLGGLVRIRKGTLWPLHAWVCVDGYMAWMLSQHRTLSTSVHSTAVAARQAWRRALASAVVPEKGSGNAWRTGTTAREERSG